jgi:excisionase family DNA binding protein
VTGSPSSKVHGERTALERDDEPMMDIDDVALFLNTSVRHIRRMVSERRIPFYKVGGKLRFVRREVREWLALLRVPEQDPTIWPIRPGRRRAS